MEEKVKHSISDDAIEIQMMTNRFTHDMVSMLRTTYPLSMLQRYSVIDFNLQEVKMIDSSSLGFLFDLHNKLRDNNKSQLIVSLGENNELRDLLHKFHVDMLLTVR